MQEQLGIQQQKAVLRKQARQYLGAQEKTTLQGWGGQMANTLFGLTQWRQAKTVFCFVSTNTEPDTFPILQAALDEGRTLCVPRTQNSHGSMDAVPIRQLQQLVAGRWGILEPAEHLPSIPPQQLDLILAPCLMAGPLGQRLGQGGGYYDRFFAQCHCPKIVLCPTGLLCQEIPLEPFDEKVDVILTEQGLIDLGV